MACMNCGGTSDLLKFFNGDQELIMCATCRQRLASGGLEKTVGRPTLGVTKKVSLTLSEESWKWFDEKAQGNRSQFLRDLVQQSPESDWSNNASLGYTILGAEKLGYTDEQISQLVKAIYSEFDWKSVEEAKEVYNKSSF